MRTTLDLNDELMAALLKRNPGVSKKEAVEAAIHEYLRRDAVEKLIALGGKIDFDASFLEEMRHGELEAEERRWKKIWG